MADSEITVEIDWTKSGTYSDESGLVRPVQAPIQASYGRDQITALAPTVAGTGSFTLDNRSKRFSPRYTSSPLYGNLKPARPVRIIRTIYGHPEQVYRTNYASNPKLGAATTYWSFSATGTGDAATLSRQTSGGPAQAATYARLTYTAASTLPGGQASGGFGYSLSATDAGLACNPGEKRSAFAMVRCSKVQRLALLVQYINGAGTNLLTTSSPQVVVAANTWTELKLDQATVAPANTVRVRILVFGVTGTSAANWAIADTLEATALCVVDGPTASPTYFDGDTFFTAVGSARHRWTGLTDGSTSEEYLAFQADTTRYLFNGHTDDNPINPDLDSRSVSVTLVDSLADFRGQEISTPLYRGIRTGEAIGYILDACGWPAALRDLDPGATVIPWWWEDGTDAFTALDKLIRSEGPPALLTMLSDGSVQFKDRHHRLLDSQAIGVQQTWNASGYGLVMAKGFSYDEAWKNIVNTGSASVDVRLPQAETAVWTSESTIALSAGEEKLVTASASDPFYDAVVPVAGTDFVQVSGTTTATLFRTSGSAATIKLSSVGAASVITGLQLRAKPVATAYTVQVSASDPVSVADYGSRSFPGDLPWCNQYDAQAVLASAVAQRAQPLPTVQARFVIGSDKTKYDLMGLDLSDRVTIVEDETSTNGDFYVESISHTIPTGVLDHEMTFGLESAPSAVSPVLRFDTSGQGFADGKFGSGIDDATNILQFDGNTGHRFDSGVFAS